MKDEKKNTWEVIISIIGLVLTLLSIFIGIKQFNRQQRQNSKIEFEREMWKKQFDTYGKLCEIAGVLASKYTTDSLFKISQIQFEQLYWGTVNFTPDSFVTVPLMEFRETLNHYHPNDPNDSYTIQMNVAILTDSCNKALSRKWKSISEND